LIQTHSFVLLTLPGPRPLGYVSYRALHEIREAAHVMLAVATAEDAWPTVSFHGLIRRWFGR
jgi:hypothetical protein